MPELPEVETTRRGIEPAVRGRVIRSILVREPRLRWRVPRELPQEAAGQRLRDLRRRAKYLLFDLENGTMILHLGMSGSLRLMPSSTAPALHDHVDIVLDSGLCVRFNDPRRFGSLLWTREDPLQHPLLRSLAPEPLSPQFNGAYLARAAAGRSVAIKQLIMNGQIVVGVGNIYASEALFRAGISPRRSAKRIKRAQFDALVKSIKVVLRAAIRDTARLRQSGRNAGILSAEAVRVRTHARAVPSVSRTDQALRAGTAFDVFLSEVSAVEF
jgi:formamidopyrimidine-DNA glycosylase